MRRPRVFVTRSIPEAGLRLVLDACNPEIWPGEAPPTHADLLRGVRRTEGLLALLTDSIDAEVMDAAPVLKVISNCAVGVDNIDLKAAVARRIPVGNTPDVLTDATADLAFALLLAAARHVVPGVEYVRSGKWKTWNLHLLLGVDLIESLESDYHRTSREKIERSADASRDRHVPREPLQWMTHQTGVGNPPTICV